ncbi:membrane protease FtsH catalytic subunit [Desulfonispora thiosulfatigenes DSM 11270]|uniref:ATP-dependent zinc metalloprotease FtsH n=1 Tax=Desulfonispora thiosulfatigenes DSM 11270 TaxID=656914 RepID=A0A1W1UYW4_DESTI|nr:ATP-dependent zinc metalloprotease FtsH [Desulfonispora thiosulfatigenes]SMB86200.1 membrane protease FtsH catalytic subunit [Desulfonispora thiosulfatigenes DSM 11270]
MNRVFKNLAIYLLIVLIAVTVLRWTNNPPVEEKVFNNLPEFIAAVEKGQIGELEITSYETYQELKGKTKANKEFMLHAPVNYDSLTDILIANNVNANQLPTPQPSWWTSVLSSLLPILLLIGVFFFMMQQTQGGGNRVMQFGKSKAKLHTDDKVKITFSDVAGVDEVKEELEEVVDFLKFPRRFTELGAKIPKGVLLFGPPGTGKTLLARAVAGEAGVPFFSISGSDFVEMFVGVGASRVRDLFEQAKKNAPCIVFVDEIDAVGRQRGAGLGGGHDEREQTLNQLLVEMDGFNLNEGIIIIAATNRPDILDPALLRPGRFDRQVAVSAPDVKGREEILQVHARNKPMDSKVDLKVMARSTPGFTGADLANLLNEAALLAARNNKKNISMNELEQSVERIIAGPEKKSRVINEFEKKIVSYHEAGHALVAELLPNCDPLHKVSIIPRGRAGGYTLLLPKEDRNYITKSHLLEQVSMMLGGRIAEKLVLNEITTGAQNDLERVTTTVRKMITEWGMSDELGTITFGNQNSEQVFLGRDIARDRNYSEAVAFSIDKEVKSIIDQRYKVAEKILSQNIDKLHLIAKELMEKETLDAVEFAKLMKGVTDSPKRTVDGETLTDTIKSDEEVINLDQNTINMEEDKNDGIIKITFKG